MIEKKLRIAYFNVIELNAGWGAEYFFNQGLIRNNCLTQTVDYRKYRYRLSRQVLAMEDFDILLLQRGDYFPFQILKAVKRPKIFWSTELVSRCRDQDRLFKSGLFDHVFVHTEECRNAVIKNKWLTAEKVSVFLPGFDENTMTRDNSVEKDIDVLFVGAQTKRRQAILKTLQEKQKITIVSAYGKEMAAYMNRAKIVLNIHSEEFVDTETRIFEALGCGAFVISETLGKEAPVESGVHYVEVKSIDEMSSQMEYYLANLKVRQQIAAAGYLKAIQDFTYTARAGVMKQTMLRLINSGMNGKNVINRVRIRMFSLKELFERVIRRVIKK